VTFFPSAKVIADSISPEGDRLTTLEVVVHRFVLSEFNTHRKFSRNSASSRAIPFAKMRSKVLTAPAIPLSWPKEQKGMQGGEELSQVDQLASEQAWLSARDSAVESADRLHKIGVHKSVINRILEPFLSHTIIVSATDWSGFFAQRCHPAAQPEIRVAAEAMKAAYDFSTPKQLGWNQWHLPYVSAEERSDFPIVFEKKGRLLREWSFVNANPILKISAARSARVSYLTHDGVRDIDKDIELFDKLARSNPPHASPLEHPACAGVPLAGPAGNFYGWRQLRHVLHMN
jgi:hypothetical protein